MFKNIREDLKTYNGNYGAQGFWAMIVFRFGKWRYSIKNTIIRKIFSLLYKIMYKFVQILTGIELPCEVNIGDNFRIDHFGSVIISGFASFGDNCTLRNNVTIGLKNLNDPGAPDIGNNVDVGSGAMILGNITIGNNVNIGANAVVMKDIPDNCIAVGIPAEIKRIEEKLR
ncbi:MAG: serine acetyltransferase [Desulfobacterales bacterium]|nr:serine acetyltransferase [Desulfobacterales bacterium]MCP4163549.1 serine acetyltransferase [Deltaproteobacteria bacterium]